MTPTPTRTFDTSAGEITVSTCVNCGEAIARGTGRGMRSWRHVATVAILCASGESIAEATT